MLDIKINVVSKLPLHKQVHEQLFNAIRRGYFERGSRMPSVRKLSESCAVSAITVERAYRQLAKDQVVSYVKGKGYYVACEPTSKLNILLVFNKLSSYKRKIYYSLLAALGENANVDLHVHHYNPKILKQIISDNLGKYNYYVVMPHFFNDSAKDEYLGVFQSIPGNELVLLDKTLPELEEGFISVFQDFENDLYDALESVSDIMEKYHSIAIIFSSESNHPPEIIKGADRFCKKYRKDLIILESITDESLIRGTVYISTSETELAELVKKGRTMNFVAGKDIGIISFNETALKELLDITVISTDWQHMGVTAGELILKGQNRQVKNPFMIIRRASL